MGEEKVRENRVRRLAERQGFSLYKSRTRDPRQLDFGRYVLIRQPGGEGPAFNRDQIGLTLDEIEEFLLRPPESVTIKTRLEEIRDQMVARVRKLIGEKGLNVAEESLDNGAGVMFRRARSHPSVGVTNGVLYIVTSMPMPLAVLGGDPVETGARAIVDWLTDPFAQL